VSTTTVHRKLASCDLYAYRAMLLFIRLNPMIQFMVIISKLIFHCNNCDAEHSSQFVKARQPRRVVVYLMQNLRLRRHPPPIIFARIVRPINALQLCRWQFSHKETL